MQSFEIPEIPRLLAFEGDGVRFAGREGAAVPGEEVAGWRLAAVFQRDAQTLAVLEHTSCQGTTLAYVGPAGEWARIQWQVGTLEALADDPAPPAFPEGYYGEIRESGADLLAGRVTDAAGEPVPERVAAALPPLVSYTFIGDRRLAEKPIVEPDGSVRGYYDSGRPYRPEERAVSWRQRLVQGWMPAVITAWYDRDSVTGREHLVFARPAGRGVGVWIRARSSEGERIYRHSRGTPEAVEPGEFYAALLAFWEEQQAALAPGAVVSLPDEMVVDGLRAGLARGLLTFVGPHPKYGVGVYGRAEHDTFPPATLYLAAAALEWGLFERAKAVLGHYLTNFVRRDGGIAYYGPAVSEYGQLLALFARCWMLTRDRDWLAEHRRPAERIAARLCALRNKSRMEHERSSPLFGLIPGLPEADYTGMGIPNEPYYSGDAWAWRGLKAYAAALDAAGDADGAACWADEARDYLADIRASVERSILRDTDPPFVPVIAGRRDAYVSLTESTAASYANYRFYPELLSAGALLPEDALSVLRYRWTHGGDLMATTRFHDHLDDWPAAHYAWGLLAVGEAERVSLLLYAHLIHHQSRGTFTAYEQVPFDPERAPVRRHKADYCVCAQLIVPLVLKWMLLWEPWDEEALWVNRAVPRFWLAPGKALSADELPTRWGRASLRCEGSPAGVRVRLSLPEGVPHARVRLPADRPLRQARVNGRLWGGFDGSVVTLPFPPQEVEIEGES